MLAFATHRTLLAAWVGAHMPLSEAERQALDALTSCPPITFGRGRELLRTDQAVERAYVLVSGWAMWHEDLPDGSRQIFDFILPGDIVGFMAMALMRQIRKRGAPIAAVNPTISFTALTPGKAVPIERDAIDRLFDHHPELGELLLSLTGVERSAGMHRRLTNAGRRSGRARIVDLLLELWLRLHEVALGDEDGFDLPVSQETLGQLVGLTPVHISRVMAQLKRDGLLSVMLRPHRKIVFHDLEALREIAESTGRGSS